MPAPETTELRSPMAATAPFGRVLVANRGEIACRIIQTLRRLGIVSIAVYSDADREAKHVGLADIAVRIGPAAASESYLDVAAVMAAAVASGADAVHPGYGFLSESPLLAAACAEAGIVFVGPSESALSVMGDKIRSKRHVAAYGVPVTPGSESSGDGAGGDSGDAALTASATAIGYPVLVKPSAGGGGKGMQVVQSAEELPAALATARRVARAAFGDDTLFLEKLIERPRHIEVQLLADRAGNTVHLGERECSLQRRHQKVIEEAPSPLLDAGTRARIGEAACAVARSVGYEGAGTVEFLVSDAAPEEFFFMEMNTRLQVEHPVTEQVTGIDIVEWQLRTAAGESLPWRQDEIALTGHSVEARIYAEDPGHDFLPTSGRIAALAEATAPWLRVDSAMQAGGEVGTHYDPMLGKVIAWGPDRASALARLDAALADTVILGLGTNLDFLRGLLGDPAVRAGHLDTGLIERHLAAGSEHGAGRASNDPDAIGPAEMLAVAAIVLCPQSPAPGAASALWRDGAGWRSGGAAAARPIGTRVLPGGDDGPAADSAPAAADLTVRRDGDGFTVTVTTPGADGAGEVSEHGVSLSCDGADGRRWPLGPSGIRVGIAVDGVQRRWSWAIDGDELWLTAAGQGARFALQSREAALQLELARIRADRALLAGGVAASPELRTPMPGTVVALHAASGDRVAIGDAIGTVEAMKMEHLLTASVAGILRLHVRLGEALRREQLVASIDADAAAPDAGTADDAREGK
ncbi:acetyl/propionyl/methylcrotonyl-CoA carboxylase subunit alpha [Microterricola gilva]|nr:biotin carboxylase N-terminal domain-containing protein [Microterricola gilva]